MVTETVQNRIRLGRSAYRHANSTVAADVLARLIAKPPVFLERTVLQLLARMGYGGLEATTRAPRRPRR